MARAPTSGKAMFCQHCGHAASGGLRLCDNCGARLPLGCPACSNLNPPDADFCLRCGRTVESDVGAAAATAGERRQLSVLFCDLVAAASAPRQLDPEDLRITMRKFHEACATVVKNRQGFLGRHVGDGILAYFGYPRAHEDDAERAINAGVQIVEAVSQLAQQQDNLLDVRVGIATGRVVVGELGEAGATAAVGSAPNLAIRLQGIAERGGVVIGDLTHRLAGRLFHYVELGPQNLRGFTTPVAAWQVTGARAAISRFAAQHDELPPLFGREQELSAIWQAWEKAREGSGHVVCLAGDSGTGKSHITHVVRERLASDDGVAVRYYRAPMYQSAALLPVIREIERGAGIDREDPGDRKLEKLGAAMAAAGTAAREFAPIVADLLSIPQQGGDRPSTGDGQHRIEVILDALVRRDLALAQAKPTLVIFEDAHWADPASLRFLGRLIERIHDYPALLLITHRPDLQPSGWSAAPHRATVRLGVLSQEASIAMIGHHAAGRALSEPVVDAIVARASGVPLFIEELTKAVVLAAQTSTAGTDIGTPGALDPAGALAAGSIPSSLHDTLMVRLDKLGSAKDIVQVAAVLGRSFTRTQLAAVARQPEGRLDRVLSDLTAQEIVQPAAGQHGVYDFRFPLLRDVAYDSLLLSRRRKLHLRIAQMLERVFPTTTDSEPELLAHHYAGAGQNERAIAYWRRAAAKALDRSANGVAIQHIESALTLLSELPETAARAKDELTFRSALGQAQVAFRGYAGDEVASNFRRLLALAEQQGDDAIRFDALRGLSQHAQTRGEHDQARRAAAEVARLAAGFDDPGRRVIADWLVGTCAFFAGDLAESQEHIQRIVDGDGLGSDDPLSSALGADPGVMASGTLAWTLWLRGESDAALRVMHDALAEARERSHPGTLITALFDTTMLHCFRGEPSRAIESAGHCLELASTEDLPYPTTLAMLAEGNALCAAGKVQEAVPRLREALERWRAYGNHLGGTLFAGTLAEACLQTGEHGRARAALDDARQLVEAGERFWSAELHRLEGRLLLAASADDTIPARRCFQAAIEVAQAQGATALARRAEAALAELPAQ